MLEVRGLDAFHGRAQALWGVDLDVGDAQIDSEIGPNGAGKTTLVNAVAGELRTVRGWSGRGGQTRNAFHSKGLKNRSGALRRATVFPGGVAWERKRSI